MQKYNAYAIQDSVVKDLKARGCKMVKITGKDVDGNKITLYSDFSEWISPNIQMGVYGSGIQRFCAISKMSKTKIEV